MLEDAIFDLLETVVVFVEDRFGVADVDRVFAVGAPWQGGDPVEVAAHDSGFRRHHRHHPQLLQLASDALFGLGREVLFAETLLEVVELVFELVLQVITRT